MESTREKEMNWADPWRRLMALTRVDMVGAEVMARRLKLSRKMRERLMAMAGPAPVVVPGTPKNHLRLATDCRNGSQRCRFGVLPEAG